MRVRLFGRKADATGPPPSPSEQERRITLGLESLREATAREVMTPRVDVVALPAPVRFSDVAAAVRDSGHSHFPVFEDDLDHLVGVLFLKDLFRRAAPEVFDGPLRGDTEVTSWVRQPELVPETRSALEVLTDLRLRRRGFAVVVDEHGGFAGVLTIKDLVSELVGEIPDEFDTRVGPAILETGSGRFLVDGASAVDDVRAATGAPIPDGEYVTIGGFLFDAFGKIPAAGDAIEREGWTFRVSRMDRRRVAKVVVQSPSANLTAGGGAQRKRGTGADGK